MTKTTKRNVSKTGYSVGGRAGAGGSRNVVTTPAGSSSVVHVDLRAGEVKPTMLRANPEELTKAKDYLGYRSNQEMVIDLIQNAVDEKAFREQRVQEQRKALSLLDDIDLSDLAEVTQFEPTSRAG